MPFSLKTTYTPNMPLVPVPSYSDIFKEEKPSLELLLHGIPSEMVILVLCTLNAKLYSEERNTTLQVDLLKLFLSGQTPDVKAKILTNIFDNMTRGSNENFELFTPLHSLEFLHLELINYRPSENIEITPEKELNIFKAYFVVVEIVNDKYSSAFATNNLLKDEFFRKNTWPILANQVEAATKVNYITELVKGISAFNYLQYHSEYTSYVQTFLIKHNKALSWSYLLDLIRLLDSSWSDYRQEQKQRFFFPVSFEINQDYESLFEDFKLDLSSYQRDYSQSKANYKGLKDKPLFYSTLKKKFIILNWDFISNKLYDGLLFDFHKNSGIIKTNRFKNFPDFKSYISGNAVEKFTFRKLVERCLVHKSYQLIKFSEDDSSPDCYFRDNNKILLFELKDALFASKATESLSYTEIKEEIDKKYNSEKKGTGQLLKYIAALSNGFYRDDNFSDKGRKCRNLTIYPILVYTDKSFSMQGINRYLREEFQRKVEEKGINTHFKKIEPLVFINYKIFIELIDKFKHVDLRTMIDGYNTEIQRREKKLLHLHTFSDFFAVQDNFESVLHQKFPTVISKSDTYVKTIFETLNMTEGLP